MRIGIDLGGTKITAIAIDNKGCELYRQRHPTCRDYPGLIRQLDDIIQHIEHKLGVSGSVGIGTPGTISRQTGRMKNCNSTCLNDQPLKQDIEQETGREIRIANDANCFALSEAIDGAGKEDSVVFGVILGTGTGGALVHNRHCFSGPNGIAGEWGHNVLPGLGSEFENEQRPCYCGRFNCVETYLSGPGLSKTYQRLYGDHLEAKNIAWQVSQGESRASEVLAIYQRQLAAGLSVVINIVDPDCVILGGGLSNIDSLYTAVPALWQSTVFSDRVDTRLLKARYGDDSGVRGAAWLWNNNDP